MAVMTRKRAAEVLLELLGDGDRSEYGQALQVAVQALAPAGRRVRAKLDPNAAAFLKARFPVGTTGGEATLYRETMGRMPVETGLDPRLVAQFRYGSRGGYGSSTKSQDEATLALVLNAERWSA